MQETLFNFFKKTAELVAGKGLGHLPYASRIYKFFYNGLKPTGIIEVRGDGHTFYINAADTGLTPPLLMHGAFAPTETTLFKRLLEPGMVFVDIGANIGYFTLLAARAVGPTGTVYGFEPDDEHHMLLEKNAKRNNYTNIVAVKMAASDTIGTASFYLQKDNLCAHSLLPDATSTEVKVAVTTLDEYFKTESRVDVIKVDVEGAEPKVMAGMKQVIAANHKIALLTEFFPDALRDSGVDPQSYLQDIVDLDFLLYRVDEDPQKNLTRITVDMIPAISKGEGIHKLINILCLKNWELT